YTFFYTFLRIKMFQWAARPWHPSRTE
ncbi:MAG: hypothetical protein QOF90_2106, partial [Acetobacteraceae bacterium]|nr:hypothetical protein [Acetobacteraceae bacterium]